MTEEQFQSQFIDDDDEKAERKRNRAPKPLQVEGPTTTDQKIKAPFTSEQVKRLNAFQKSGLFHPFTCGNPERTDENHPDRGILVATRGGWVCPNCYYTQDWAHAFMVEAGAEATTKPDYLNKTLRECSREELMEALRVTEEKNKEIDAKSCISPEALDVRAGAEATGKSDPQKQLEDWRSLCIELAQTTVDCETYFLLRSRGRPQSRLLLKKIHAVQEKFALLSNKKA